MESKCRSDSSIPVIFSLHPLHDNGRIIIKEAIYVNVNPSSTNNLSRKGSFSLPNKSIGGALIGHYRVSFKSFPNFASMFSRYSITHVLLSLLSENCCFQLFAQSSGVLPFSSLALTSAPSEIRHSRNAAVRLVQTAMCNGVQPSFLFALTFALNATRPFIFRISAASAISSMLPSSFQL